MIFIVFIFIIRFMIKSIKRPTIPENIKSAILENKKIRICIVGVSGAGKTRLRHSIIDYHKSIHNDDICSTNCDDIFFKECFCDYQEFNTKLNNEMKKSKKNKIFHVIDGANYKAMKTQVWPRCDSIIYVNTNYRVRIYNFLIREFTNWWFNRPNEIGNKPSLWKLFIKTIKDQNSILWNVAGYSYQQKKLETALYNLENSKKKHIEKLITPTSIIYSFIQKPEQVEEKVVVKSTEEKVEVKVEVKPAKKKIEVKPAEEKVKISEKDKVEITSFVFEYLSKTKNIDDIKFIGIGASSFADGRATQNSDYDIFVVYLGYNENIQKPDLKHITKEKTYEIREYIR